MTAEPVLVPISRLIRPEDWKTSWPGTIFGPSALKGNFSDTNDIGDWLDKVFKNIYFSDYRIIEGDSAAGFDITLWIKGPMDLSINGFLGCQFIIGGRDENDWVRIPATIQVSPDFELLLPRIGFRVILDESIVELPWDKPDPLGSWGNQYRVDIPMTGKLRIDSSFDLHFDQENPISFGPVELMGSGFIITVGNAVLDLSREEKVQSIVDAGLPDDFRGFFSQKITVKPPGWLGIPENLEMFMENFAIGSKGLYGTIGIRDKLAEELPPNERPTIISSADRLIHSRPDNSSESNGDLKANTPVHVLARSKGGGWYYVDRGGDPRARKLGIGYGWVDVSDASVIKQYGDKNKIPVIAGNPAEKYDNPLDITINQHITLNFNQFYITFEESLPVAVGISGKVKLKDFHKWFQGNEQLELIFSVDSSLGFTARLQESAPPSQIPDTNRTDTFAIIKDIIIFRIDGIEFQMRRPNRNADWLYNALLDISVFFRWSFSKRNAKDGEQLGVCLKGIGWKDGSPAFPTAAKLHLSQSTDTTPDPYTRGLTIGPFAFSIDSLGAGTDSGGASFISFSGSVALSVGFKMKGTGGVRFLWRSGDYLGARLDKIGMMLDTSVIRGELMAEYIDEMRTINNKLEAVTGWRGRGKFFIKFPPEIYVILEAAFGDNPFKYVYLSVDAGCTAAGIPCGPVSFYGFAGLFGFNYVPGNGKDPKKNWYEGWYLLDPVGATGVEKWYAEKDAISVGLGATVGTSGDKGFAWSSDLFVMLSFPGPDFMLIGRGNILRSIEKLKSGDTIFTLLIMYDGNARTFEITASVQYKIPRDGNFQGWLLDVFGLFELFFDLKDSGRWYVHLGGREREKRNRATFIYFLRVESYILIEPILFEIGEWSGWEWEKTWGPLHVSVGAWTEGVYGIIYEPTQGFGVLSIGGRARLKAFWFRIGISLDASLAGGAPNPWFYYVRLMFTLELPWFLPDISVTCEISNKSEAEKQVALVVHGTALTCDDKGVKMPDYTLTLYPDLGNGSRIYDPTVDKNFSEADAVADAPVVPLDAKPVIAFGHPINDMTRTAIKTPPVPCYAEAFGDEGYFRYDLTKIQISNRPRGSKGEWVLLDERIIGKERSPINWDEYIDDLHIFGTTELRGEMLMDCSHGISVPVGLKLWAKTPFHMAKATSEEAESSLNQNPSFPCPGELGESEMECVGYNTFNPGDKLERAHPLGRLWICSPEGGRVIPDKNGLVGRYFIRMQDQRMHISLPEPAHHIRIRFNSKHTLDWTAGRHGDVILSGNTSNQAGSSGTDELSITDDKKEVGFEWVEFEDPNLTYPVTLSDSLSEGSDVPGYYISEICYKPFSLISRQKAYYDSLDRVRNAYSGKDIQAETFFKPDHEYRITLESQVLTSERIPEPDRREDWHVQQTFTQYTYFKTAGPPGLFPMESAVKDLIPYVNHTVPAGGADPVYRGDDIRIAFNADTPVLGMYRWCQEELKLIISDGREYLKQALDGKDRPDILSTEWSRDSRIPGSYQLTLWKEILGKAPCLKPPKWSGGDILTGTPKELLEPERKYTADLVLDSSPYMLRNSFVDDDLKSMTMVNPGKWEVRDETLFVLNDVTQPRLIKGTPFATPGGTLLVFGDPSWRNCQVVVTVQIQNGHFGVIAGYQDALNYYLASVNVKNGIIGDIELIRTKEGISELLAEYDSQQISASQEKLHNLALKCSGEWLQVTFDDKVFDRVADATFTRGKAAIFTAGAAGAGIHSLQISATPLYSFSFTTSRFSSFTDHIASYPGSSAHLPVNCALPSVTSLLTQKIASFPKREDLSDDANRRRDLIFTEVIDLLGLPSAEPLPRLEITLVHGQDGPFAWLIESPEPLHLKDRTTLGIEYMNEVPPAIAVDDDLLRCHPCYARIDSRVFDQEKAWINQRISEGRLPSSRGEKRTSSTGTIVSWRNLRQNKLPRQDNISPMITSLISQNPENLRLACTGTSSNGSWYIDFIVRKKMDLSGTSLEFQENSPTGEIKYQEFFQFPDRTMVSAGETIRIYNGNAPDSDLSQGICHKFSSGGTCQISPDSPYGLVRTITKQGNVLIFPFYPMFTWDTIDPKLINIIYTTDTRKALVFISGTTGTVKLLDSGQYRFRFTYKKDIDPRQPGNSHPEWTLSCKGKSDPEEASVYVSVPASPPEISANGINVFLEEIKIKMVARQFARFREAGIIRFSLLTGGDRVISEYNISVGDLSWDRINREFCTIPHLKIFTDQIIQCDVKIIIKGILNDREVKQLPPLTFLSGDIRLWSISPEIERIHRPEIENRSEIIEQKGGAWSICIKFTRAS